MSMFDGVVESRILAAITEAYESREDYASYDSCDARNLAGIALWQALR